MKKLSFLTVILASLLVFHTQAKAQSGTSPTVITFLDASYSDLKLQGLYASSAFYMPLPSNWKIARPIEVVINYTASTLLVPDISTLTVSVNGRALTSINPIVDGEEHSIAFTVPIDLNFADGLAIDFQAYLPVSDAECLEINNPAQWLIIRNSSKLTIYSEESTSNPDLQDLPHAIIIENALTPTQVIIVIPDKVSSTTLTVAGQVAARLGHSSGGRLRSIAAQNVSGLTEQQEKEANLIYIGLIEELPEFAESTVPLPAAYTAQGFLTSSGEPVSAEHGVIQIFNSQVNPARKVLLVTSQTEAGLQLAGQAFGDTATYSSMQGRFVFVQGLEPGSGQDSAEPWLGPETTLSQLGYGQDRTINGVGSYDLYYDLNVPPGWVFKQGTVLTLDFIGSPALAESESNIEVFINETLVGAIPTKQESENANVTINLPLSVLNEQGRAQGRPTKLQLQVNNFVTTAACEKINLDAPWTTVSSTRSFLTTPHTYMTLPDLFAYPYPFVSDKVDSPPVAIILPESPTLEEIAQGISIVQSLGRHAPRDFELVITTADKADSQVFASYNLILLGTRERNTLIEEFLQAMPSVPVRGLYQSLETEDIGVLQEGFSLWNANRIVLLAYSESKVGLLYTVNALSDVNPPVTESGSVAIVSAGRAPRVVFPARDPFSILKEGRVPAELSDTGAEVSPTLNPAPEPEKRDVNAIVRQPVTTFYLVLIAACVAILFSLVILRGRRVEQTAAELSDMPNPERNVGSVTALARMVNGQGERILIIDDDRALTRLVHKILALAGYVVIEAEDPLRGIEVAEAERPDLIIVDVMMADIDGFQVVKRLRGRPDLQDVPVLMLSSLTTLEHRITGLESGADDYMGKPFDRQELLLRISGLLRRARGEALVPPEPAPPSDSSLPRRRLAKLSKETDESTDNPS